MLEADGDADPQPLQLEHRQIVPGTKEAMLRGHRSRAPRSHPARAAIGAPIRLIEGSDHGIRVVGREPGVGRETDVARILMLGPFVLGVEAATAHDRYGDPRPGAAWCGRNENP
jgi:hypothetical protein